MNILEDIKLQIQTSDKVIENTHWHETLEIIFVLSGTAFTIIGNQQYTLKTDDVIIINPYTMHQCNTTDGITLIYHLNLQILKSAIPNDYKRYFTCNSSIDTKREYYKPLIWQLANIANMYMTQTSNPYIELLYHARIEFLMYELYTNFSTELPETPLSESQTFQKFQVILNDIQENYNQGLTLYELAKRHYMTQPYISNLFHRYLGKSYTQYIVSLRLKKACDFLLTTNYNIEYIASLSGFSNSRSFSNYFKDSYGTNPAAYRKQHLSRIENQFEETLNTDLNSPTLLAKILLEKYSDIYNIDYQSYPKPRQNIQLPVIDLHQKSNQFMDNHHIFSVTNYHHLLYSNILKMCQNFSKSIGSSRFLLNNIIGNDTTSIFQTKDNKLINIYFGAIDTVLDILNSLNIRPIFALDFSQLCNGDSSKIISIMLEHLYLHYNNFVADYGFCIIISSDYINELNNYLQIWFNNIESIAVRPKVYVHIQYNDVISNSDLFSEHLTPDYIIAEFEHFYMDTKSIQTYISALQNSKWKNVQSIMSDISPLNNEVQAINDSLIRASYVLNTWLTNSNNFCGTACYLLTDYSETIGKNERLFTGRNGIYTYRYLRKSSFYLFDNLKFFTGELLYVSTSCIIKKDNSTILLLLQNPSVYESYEDKQHDIAQLTYSTDLLDGYPSLTFNVSLKGIEFNKYIADIFQINADHGCSFHYWLESNSLSSISELQLINLQGKGFSNITNKMLLSENNYLNFSMELKPCEFMLIRLNGIKDV